MLVTDKYVFFWGGIFSNWNTVPSGIRFELFGEKYDLPTSEHVFMLLKALCFGDQEVIEELKKVSSPKDAKRLGRKVKGFSEDVWKEKREDAMMFAVRQKILSDPSFLRVLTSSEYKGKTFVEASPYDKIWGIGMEESDPEVTDETKWKGLNLLGKTLTTLRDEYSSSHIH